MANSINQNDSKLNGNSILDKSSAIEEKIKSLKEGFSEIVEIRKHIVEKNLNEISKAGTKDVLKALIPSIIVLILSLYIDVAHVPILGDVAQKMFSSVFKLEMIEVQPVQFWWLPFAAFGLFMVFAWMSNASLKKQITLKGPSEEIITRTVDNYSGLVDSIATAMPLLGAAILLLSTQLGKDVFLGFSVPFEIKSIVILAIGKLFGTVFETQALQYQTMTEEVSNVEKEYNYYTQYQVQNKLVDTIKLSNEQLMISLTGSGSLSKFTVEEAQKIYDYIKLTKQLNDEHTKNLDVFRKTVADFGQIKLFDSQILNQMKEVIEGINKTADVVKKTAEYTETMKANFEVMKGFSAAISSVKLPDSASLVELQKTASLLNETANSLKDSNAMKSIENLVYLAGKR
ncbi:MAG: hypothetical protein WC139_07625 [Candidatus Kapaibacterium sp.]